MEKFLETPGGVAELMADTELEILQLEEKKKSGKITTEERRHLASLRGNLTKGNKKIDRLPLKGSR